MSDSFAVCPHAANITPMRPDRVLAKPERQRLVLSLIGPKRLGTQQDLLGALEAAGCRVTQATVSRDIRELGLEKEADPFGRHRYVAPGTRRADPRSTLRSLLEQFGRGATPAANIVVVHCEIGAAPAIARALDRAASDADRGARGHWLPNDLPELPPLAGRTWHRWRDTSSRAETIAALARRCRVSFDGQGLVRVPQVGPLQLDTDYDPELLRHVWALKLAEEEAEIVGDVSALGVREVIVTHGSRGATVHAAGGMRARERARCRHRPDRRRRRVHDGVCRRTQRGLRADGAARRATAVVAAVLSRR